MHNNWTEKDITLFKTIAADEIDKLIDSICENNIIEETMKFKFKAELIETFYNVVIKTEFEMFMNDKDKNLKRNGTVEKKVNTTEGEIDVKVPRDRYGNYYPASLLKYSKTTEELSKVILNLLEFGISTRDVTIFLERTYGLNYSKSSISNYSEALLEKVDEYKSRRLSNRYIALYLDATYIPIKFTNKYERQALHLVVGINEKGYQEIIGYKIGFRENNILWAEVLDDLKVRGVSEVDIIVSDGFVGIQDVIKKRYPDAGIQRCTVHVTRNILSKVKVKDLIAIKSEISNLFKMTDISMFKSQLNYLMIKYPQYESMLRSTFQDETITTYLSFQVCIQKTFRTTNRIESVNQKIKTRIKFRQQFPSVEAFEKILVASIITQNNYFDKVVHGVKDYIPEKRNS